MKQLLCFGFFCILLINANFAQIVESKNWCPSQCHLAGDEKINTDLLYLRLKNGHFTEAKSTDEIKRIPLRIGIVQEDDSALELSLIHI